MAELQYWMVLSFLLIVHYQISYAEELAPTDRRVETLTDIFAKSLEISSGLEGPDKNFGEVAFNLYGLVEKGIFGVGITHDTALNTIRELSVKIGSIGVNIRDMKNDIIVGVLKGLEEKDDLTEQLQKMFDDIEDIDEYLKDLIYILKNIKLFSGEEIQRFMKVYNIDSVIRNLNRRFYEDKWWARDSVLKLLSKRTQNNVYVCQYKQSHNQFYLTLYNAVLLTNCKGLLILAALKRIHKPAGKIEELTTYRTVYYNRYQEMTRAVKKVMKNASREVWTCHGTEGTKTRNIWSCDEDAVGDIEKFKKAQTDALQRFNKAIPANKTLIKNRFREAWSCKENIHGGNYTKLHGFVKKYVVNDHHIHPEGSCKNDQIDFRYTEMKNCVNGLRYECIPERFCDGILTDCSTELDGNIEIWFAPIGSDRRMHKMRFKKNGTVYGKKGYHSSNLTSIGYHGTLLNGQCENRICTCDEIRNKYSDRNVNMRMVEASVNHVVTGLRFVKKNHILHLQIKQGVLGKSASVVPNTNHWKDLEDTNDIFSLQLVTKNSAESDLPLRYTTRAAISLGDEDFAKESDKKKYMIENRDEVSSVVTAVKFDKKEVNHSGVHLHLSIRMTPFNYRTGELQQKDSFWYSKLNASWMESYNLNKIELDGLEAPSRYIAMEPKSKITDYIVFSPSSLQQDVGQTTLPFIDLESVETEPPTPLSGVGLYHKAEPGTGGFLALKLLTFDSEPFL